MASRLADEISLNLIGLVLPIKLRPTLRAAIRLERLHGIDKLAPAILGGNLTVIRSIIRETAIDDPADALLAISAEPLSGFLNANTVALFEIVILLMGADPEEAGKESDDTAPATKLTPWAKVYRRLFKHAVIAFGWTPSTILNATVGELNVALGARLHANAVADAIAKNEPIPADPDDPEEFEAEPIYERDKYLALAELGKVR